MSCHCKHGEYHGYPPAGSPDWAVGTIYFWCPIYEQHGCLYNNVKPCPHFEIGKPRRFDKHGNEVAEQ